MSQFRFYHPLEVRFGDLDSFRHVNHARHFTYMEQARAEYLRRLGLWDGRDFDALGIILAEASCSYKTEIAFGQPIHVGVRTARLGTKSIEMEYEISDRDTGEVMAVGRTVVVAFDYRQARSIPIPEAWRATLTAFEGLAQL